ncbi:MAG: TauD/TfdA family dioxygenase [Hyphomicrobiales bacterium]
MSGGNDDPLMVFDPDLMVGVGEESGRAIKALKGELDRNRKGVVLKVGDLLIIDNLKAVHGRTPFVARYDGGDRWLQRLVVKRDLRVVEKNLGRKKRILTWVADQFLNANSRRTDGPR